MRTTPHATVLIALCGLLPGQETAGSTVQEDLRRQIEARIEEMRERISEGVPITTNVRVTVKLRNGARIKGVVKNGRFIERVRRLDFVPADMQTPGAGIRVWYYDNTKSFIFLPFHALESYKIGARLTAVEIEAIEKRIESSQRGAKATRAEAGELEPAARRDEDGPAPAAPDAPAESELAKADAALLALLEEFSPDEGWSTERAAEIRSRKITIGVYPSPQEERFLEVLEDWKRALHLAEEREAQTAQPLTPSQPEPQPQVGGPPL